MKNNLSCKFSPQDIEDAKQAGRLLSMELELSRACNLRCIYCYADSGTALDAELSLAEILDAVDQAVELGAKRIIVLGGGEPLVHPDILTILRHIHHRGAGIDLFTNGTRITAGLAGEFMALGVSPVIKMNSMREDVQDMLRGLGEGRPTMSADAAGFMLRGFFEALRRHVAFERTFVVPLLELATRRARPAL